jgi:hypothetical protein
MRRESNGARRVRPKEPGHVGEKGNKRIGGPIWRKIRRRPMAYFAYKNTFLFLQTISKLKAILNSY